MSAKVKLISFISAFVLVLGIMIIGVLSAEQVQVNIGGSVSFNATNVYAKVSGNISGAETGNKTFSTLTYSASETTGDESDWTNLALEFTETPDPIIITITVENLSTQRTLTANLTNSLSASGLNIAITRDSGIYSSGTNFELPVSTGDGSSTTTFTLSLTVANPNEDLTNVTFGYILNLFDENYTPPPTPASSFTFSYRSANHTASITKFVGSETEVIIPSTVEYNSTTYKVTAIADSGYRTGAFYNSNITSVVIPDTVTSIGEDAFYGCSRLTSITIPDTVTSIGNYAFYGCSRLTSITIPNTVTSIGNNAFHGCSSLTSITIPSRVTSISDHAFSNCSSLTSITIPSRVTSIGDGAFENCSSLTSITIPSRVTSISFAAFSDCSSLTSITIPEGVTSIGDNAFQYCSSLTSITIPEGVTSIGDWAFSGCYALAEVYNYSNLKVMAGGSGNGYLGYYAKVVYNASDLTGEKPATRIKDNNGVRYYDDGENTVVALYPLSRNVTTVSFDSRTTEIQPGTFRNCSSLTSIIIPSSVTSIGESTFSGCSSLTSITIPDSVTIISSYAFSGCSSLTSITIPSSVTSISDRAFSGCYALAEVYNYSPSITVNLGETNPYDNGYLGQYAKVVYNASDLTGEKPETRIKDNNGVRYYDDGENTVVALYPLSRNVTTVSFDSRTTEIQPGAFNGCSSLTSITIPSSVTSIGNNTFESCTSLTSITIPSSVTSISDRAFFGCDNLAMVNFGENSQLTSIGNYAFNGCSSLTSITIPEGVTSIGNYAFEDCSSLTSITIPEGVTSIGNSAFWICSSLTSITIPSSVTSIGSNAFFGCNSLTSITINATTPPTLGSGAIPSNVTNIYVPSESVEAYKAASRWSSYASKISAIVNN